MVRSVRARLLVATTTALIAAASAGVAAAAPSVTEGGPASSYVVVYRDSAVATTSSGALTARLADEAGATVSHRYSHALRGFAATMSATAARRLAANPAVTSVEPVHTFQLSDLRPYLWNLDRLDQRRTPMDGVYTTALAGQRGEGVSAYVIDTGVSPVADFGGRAVWGTNTTGDGTDRDCNGHGTHVAGTLGGAQYGIATSVRVVAVKVFGCDRTTTTDRILAGIDWVVANHTSGPAVANMSFGGPVDAALDTAVGSLLKDGVVVVAASGNDNTDACSYSPAHIGNVITVNASTEDDVKAGFSNYGPCTDLFAPGENIASDSNDSSGLPVAMSGTSMAAPHVAGVAARLLSTNPTLTPGRVGVLITSQATTGVISGVPARTPNRFLFASPPFGAVTLCSDNNLRGRCVTTAQDIPDLGATAVGNDALSSIGGSPKGQYLLLYSDVNWAGTCQAFASSKDVLAGTTIGNDTASSVRFALSKEDCGGLAITRVKPSSGPLGGGNWVTIDCTGCRSVEDVFFGDQRVINKAIGDHNLNVAAPPGTAPGTVDVRIRMSNGTTSQVTDKSRYTYKSG